MNICATIAEFNPFHNGHKYLIDSVKGNFDACIAVMSGNFVQRGAPAIYDKFSRARAAVMNGVDLVIELPLIYALSSAETFAKGAVEILNATNSVSTLFFGSECGDMSLLKDVAISSSHEDEEFKRILKQNLASGMSYPKAKSAVLESMGVNKRAISSPNNILGIEYIKALISSNSSIEPFTIGRSGVMHDSSVTTESIASASHIRSVIKEGGSAEAFMPSFEYPSPVFDFQFSDILLYALKSSDYDAFLEISDCSPSLASRFASASSETSVEGVISCVKSKNCTESRIRRIMWNLVLKNNISPNMPPEYIRPLAMNEKGASVISQMRKKASLPIIQKGVHLKESKIFAVEAKATDIYNIVRNVPSGEDFRHSPIMIK
jgi:predicted nucleotidyltransferase